MLAKELLEKVCEGLSAILLNFNPKHCEVTSSTVLNKRPNRTYILKTALESGNLSVKYHLRLTESNKIEVEGDGDVVRELDERFSIDIGEYVSAVREFHSIIDFLEQYINDVKDADLSNKALSIITEESYKRCAWGKPRTLPALDF